MFAVAAPIIFIEESYSPGGQARGGKSPSEVRGEVLQKLNQFADTVYRF